MKRDFFRCSTSLVAATFVVNSLTISVAHADVPPNVSSSTTIGSAAKPFPRTPQSLKDAYLAAVVRSETIDMQRELVNQANENTSQAWGAIAPTISGSATFLHQQIPNTSNNNPGFLQDQRTTKLTADQPLFRGLRDLATIRQRKSFARAQVFAFKQAAKQLFSDLTIAYYNVLAYKADEKNYLDEIEINQKRLVELRHFLQIGRSRQTDLLTFQSNITALEAQVEVTRGSLENAKDVLAYLTGWNRETPIRDLEIPTPGNNIDELITHIEDRPDVKSALDTASGYTEGVPIARGAHLPNLDLIGDYYFDRPGLPSGQADWDVQLVLSVPIFEGGIVNSQVRQAQSVSTQYELSLSQTRRLAEEEIRTLFDSFQSDMKQVSKLEENVMWSKKNFEAEIHDYRLGLVTNLDVLTAITQYQDAQRQLDHTRMQTKSDGARLQAAAAQRPEIDVPFKDRK